MLILYLICVYKVYAGSHGFDIRGPADLPLHLNLDHGKDGTNLVDTLLSVQNRLSLSLANIHGAWVENNKLALSAHYRMVRQ